MTAACEDSAQGKRHFESPHQLRGPRRGGPSLRDGLKSRRGGNPGEA